MLKPKQSARLVGGGGEEGEEVSNSLYIIIYRFSRS